MGFTYPGHRVWDFWLANDQWATADHTDHHLFFLFAPDDDPGPNSHHQRARIGHAVSADLRDWDILPRPLQEPAPGSPDDRATWTGCTVRAGDGVWHMFYTGVSTAEDGQVQRILSATSTDLITWTRTSLCLEGDPQYYEKWTSELPEEHWRDPWVEWIPDLDCWLMFITARADVGPSDGRGVIALASSMDLTTWTVHPPVTAPGHFRQLEVPQLLPLADGWGLLFAHGPDDVSAARLADPRFRSEGGMHLYFADRPTGPFRSETDVFFHRGVPSTLYGARIHRHAGDQWLLATNTVDDDGAFIGGVSEPFRVAELRRGVIALEPEPRTRR